MDARTSIRDDLRQSTVNVNSWNAAWTADLNKSLPNFHQEIVNIGDGFRSFNIPSWGDMTAKRISPNDGRGTARDSAQERVVIEARGSTLSGRASIIPERGNEIIRPDGSRESIVPNRQSILPGRLSVLPGRESIIPGRESVVPSRESIVPGRNSVIPPIGRESILANRDSILPGRSSVLPGRQSASDIRSSARSSVSLRDIVMSEITNYAIEAKLDLNLLKYNRPDPDRKNLVFPKRTPAKEVFKNDKHLIRFPIFRGILYHHPDTNAVDHIEEGGNEILRGKLFATFDGTDKINIEFTTCEFPYEEFIKKDYILEDDEFERDNDLSLAPGLPSEVNRQAFLDNYFPEKLVTRGGFDYAYALRYPCTTPDGLYHFSNKSVYNGSEFEIHFTVIYPGISINGLFVNNNHGANELEVIWELIEEIPSKIGAIYRRNSNNNGNDSLWRRKFTFSMLSSIYSMMKEIKLTSEFKICWEKKIIDFSTRSKKAEYVDNGIIEVFDL